MLAFFAAAFAGFVGLCSPISGLFIFLFANTGAEGVLNAMSLREPTLGPFRLGTAALIGCVLALLLRPGRPPLGASRLLISAIWVLTGLMVISRVVELRSIDSRLVWELLYAALWAPLLLALLKLDRHEQRICRHVVVFLSAWTALLALTISLTGSDRLYNLLATRSEELDLTGYLAGRVQVAGLWGFMPFGLWFGLRDLYMCDRLSSKAGLLNISAMLLILLEIAVNLTRALLLGVLAGGLVALTGLSFGPGRDRRRVAALALLLATGLSIGLLVPELAAGWGKRVEEAQIGGSVEGRILRNEHVFGALVGEIPMFGRKDYWATEWERSLITGDPHTILTVWANYGTLAGVVFVTILMLIPVKLFRLLVFTRNRSSWQLRAEALFLGGFYVFLHWYMLGGNYLLEVTVFMLMYFVAEIVRLEDLAAALSRLGTPLPAVRGVLRSPRRSSRQAAALN